MRVIIQLVVLLCISLSSIRADIRLPLLVADGMVLQHNEKVKLWGWADPGEVITVNIGTQSYTTKTDKSGNWQLVLPRQKAGGPVDIRFQGNNMLEVKDVYFGEVWLCSGQSNMELPMRRVKPLYEDEFLTADYPQIRCFTVNKTYHFKAPQNDVTGGNWIAATPENLAEFPAAAYFFAKHLHQTYEVPVGLINASLGGSPVQSWMSEEALKSFPSHLQEAYKYRDDTLIQSIEQSDNERIGEWYRVSVQKDKGQAGAYRYPETNTNDWSDFKLPAYWGTYSQPQNGVFWFRKDIPLSSKEASQSAFLNLGRIVDADSVFINGHSVGVTTYQYPPRWYQIPADVLREGCNSIVIRVINSSGPGGFVPDKPYELKTAERTIDLKGRWRMKQGSEMLPLGSQTFIRWKPLGLYNAMIAPLLNYTIKGAIWYQGEANTSDPIEYSRLFPALIRDWRKQFNQGNFPFLFVQLPNFMETKELPSESRWAETREAQMSALREPATGMAVAIDLGEWNDIHPLNKRDVGNRLALLARKIAYKEKKLIASGPTYKSMKVKNGRAEISFTNIGAGLMTRDEPLKGFAIAGFDGKFVWANAEISGNKVIVWHESVSIPVRVRYAWADNPDQANLFNKDGLPATPFRTDANVILP
ncbi:MAG: sialate O-acetylesterase [Paludibacter sp.]|nr:sialate O-acetylesterase [Paludibacter sp.]